MISTMDTAIAAAISLPGLYGFICFFRRMINAKRAADWVKSNYQAEWNSLHWLARRSNWAGVEVLVSKGLISGPELEQFRTKDEDLEKATWVGMFISAALLFVVVIVRTLAALFG